MRIARSRFCAAGRRTCSFVDPEDLAGLRADVVSTSAEVTAAALAGDAAGAVRASEKHRLLCAASGGPVRSVVVGPQRDDVDRRGNGGPLDPERWYAGQPLMVTANDHEMRIYNGDTGVVVEGSDGDLVAAFARGEEPIWCT